MADDLVMDVHSLGRGKTIPQTGLLFINPAECHFIKKYAHQNDYTKHSLFNSNLFVSPSTDQFIAGPAIGSPMAVICLEHLVSMGAQKIVVVGWCGGLLQTDQIGELVVVQDAVSAEGTSGHYSQAAIHTSSPALSSEVSDKLSGMGFSFRYGRMWTTDAPFMERRSQLLQLIEDEAIDGVEMELSGLFCVAAYRKIDLAATLLVSDLPLAEKWIPGFRQKSFLKKSEQLVTVLLQSIRDER